MAIAQQSLTTTEVTVLTVPAGQRYALTTVMVCNGYSPNGPDAANQSNRFDMHFVQNGQASSFTTNVVVRDLELPAGETFTFDSEKIVLEEGDRVTFTAEGNGPELRLVLTGATSVQNGETITQANSGATGTVVQQVDSSTIQLSNVSGTFNTTDELTGSSSGALGANSVPTSLIDVTNLAATVSYLEV